MQSHFHVQTNNSVEVVLRCVGVGVVTISSKLKILKKCVCNFEKIDILAILLARTVFLDEALGCVSEKNCSCTHKLLVKKCNF